VLLALEGRLCLEPLETVVVLVSTRRCIRLVERVAVVELLLWLEAIVLRGKELEGLELLPQQLLVVLALLLLITSAVLVVAELAQALQL
jgi:hypothetical protein